jgi:hypothetical protein
LIRLEAVIKNPTTPGSLKAFSSTLRTDILDYGTLPSYTLRRIADAESNGSGLEEILAEIGLDYLEREVSIVRNIDAEIVMAYENRVNVK